jgi:twitching motility two-component system response regulator PilH
VLIVDDDLDTLETLEAILQMEGVTELRKARSLAEANQILASGFRPCAVLLDLMLDRERGETLLRRLASDPTTADIPVIVFSGDHQAFNALGLPPERLLMKPAWPEDVVRVLGYACKHPKDV